MPKFLPNPDGTPGRHNDVRCAGIEHKLGIKGSPTCTMVFGDAGGATGWLVGEANKGLACMFTMMNKARLLTGLQGIAIAEKATQMAQAYALERRQGRAVGFDGAAPIAAHPDVARTLARMKALTVSSRAIAYAAAAAIDRAATSPTAEAACAGRDAGEPAHPDRQGVLHRCRLRGGLKLRAGAWRHGLHRGDRRGAALPRHPHRADL